MCFLKGILLAIKTNDFYQRIKTNEETWNLLNNLQREKEFAVQNMLFKKDCIQKENSDISKLLVKKVEEDLNLSDLDFFKTVFWCEPIPPRKIDKIIEFNT